MLNVMRQSMNVISMMMIMMEMTSWPQNQTSVLHHIMLTAAVLLQQPAPCLPLPCCTLVPLTLQSQEVQLKPRIMMLTLQFLMMFSKRLITLLIICQMLISKMSIQVHVPMQIC